MPLTTRECLGDSGVRKLDPVSKQKDARRQMKAATRSVKVKEIERPRKRRRSQTTMTQLDLGRRSFLDVIGDSDGEDSEIDATPKPRKPSRKRKLPAKTESQDTLTQFIKRSSDVSELVISDTENEGSVLSDSEPANIDETMYHQVPLSQEVQLQHQTDSTEHAEEQTCDRLEGGRDSDAQSTNSQVDIFEHLPASRSSNREARTPKRVRVLPVPSSRSPPDTLLSSQITPSRNFEPSEPRSPLQERSANVQNIPHTVRRGRSLKSPSPNRVPGAISVRPLRGKGESPIKRRVRDFNTRFAILEQENAHVRSRRMDSDLPRLNKTISSDHNTGLHSNLHEETQYTMPGFETQAAWLELPVAAHVDEARLAVNLENNAETAQRTQATALSAEKSTAKSSTCHDIGSVSKGEGFQNTENKEGGLSPQSEDILIPSSQSRRSANTSGNGKMAKAVVPEADKSQFNDESLPESTYNSLADVSIPSKQDTQDLASDQLMRETQQAFQERVPSSPLLLATSSAHIQPRPSEFTSQGRCVKLHPSQASTVDEPTTFSSLRPQNHRSVETKSMFKRPVYPLSSSPAAKSLPSSSANQVVIISSPLMHAPDLTDLSSSPIVPEPKTPSALRNLKAPLQLNDLVSESLDQSYPIPPSWRYDDDDEDDGEL